MSMKIKKEILSDIEDALNIGIAYIPFGLIIGINSSLKGMPPYLAFVLSGFVYSGSAEFIILNLVYMKNISNLSIIISVFLVNLRYVIMAIPLFQNMKNVDKKTKCIIAPFLTDEIISYSVIHKKFSKNYLYTLNFFGYLFFVLSTILGNIFTKYIPIVIIQSMNFIIYGIFLTLIITGLKSNFKYLKIIILTLINIYLFKYTFLNDFIHEGLEIIVILVLSVIFSVLIDEFNGSDRNE